MSPLYLRLALIVLGFGAVLGLLYFLSGLNRGLGFDRAARRPLPAGRVGAVRGLVLVMGVALIGGIVYGRPLLLLLAAACLGLTLWRGRR